MSRAKLALAVGIALITSSCPPSASGPGFRLAPEPIRGPAWSELCSRLHATVTLVDLVSSDYHVRIAHLPEGDVADYVIPHGRVLSATSIPGEKGAYCLVQHSPWLVLPYYDIIRLEPGAEGKQVFVGKGRVHMFSSIALSPDGSTIALLYRPEPRGYASGPWHLALIDPKNGHRSDQPGEFGAIKPIWTRDSQSLLLLRESADASAAPDIVRFRVPADGNPEVIAHGDHPLLASDGNSLLFVPHRALEARWCTLDGSPVPDLSANFGGFDLRRALAIGPESEIVFNTKADSRIPLEHTGYFAVGPVYRGGISVSDPSSREVETLFVGVAPFEIEWRWD